MISVVTDWRFECAFDPNGWCGTCGKSIADHAAIATSEVMTLEEARRRYPDSDWVGIEAALKADE